MTASKHFGLASETTVAQLFWVCTFAILTAVGAQIEIPHQPVPYTFQTLFVLLAGALLGIRNGFLSMMLYLTLGAIGLPMFSGGGFGLTKLFGPTGGYLFAFPISAVVVGYLASLRKEFWWTVASMSVGLLIIFSFGTVQLNLVYFKDWSAAFKAGFLIFSWWDALKLFAAATIYHQVVQKIRGLS